MLMRIVACLPRWNEAEDAKTRLLLTFLASLPTILRGSPGL